MEHDFAQKFRYNQLLPGQPGSVMEVVMHTALDRLEEMIAPISGELKEIRHELHAHPQLGYDETYARDLIIRELERLNIAPVTGIAGTGVVGLIEPEGNFQKAIALRADMDALPIQEESGLPWASRISGKMHACGHDGHVAILIGATRILSRLRDRLPCPIKVIFQPAEEGGQGGKAMVEQGVLTEKIARYAVRAAFALHGYPNAPVGQYLVRSGPMMAALDDLDVEIKGKGGHASRPQDTIDPIIAAAHIVTSLQTIISRNVDSFDQAVITIAQISAGQKHNIIPETATMKANIRSLNPTVRQLILRRFKELANAISEGFQCSAEINHSLSIPATVNDEAMTGYCITVAKRLLGADNVREKSNPSMGSEDFSYFCQAVPSCIGYLGVRPVERAEYPGLHNVHFDFTDEAIDVGVKLMCSFALSADGILRE
jgi:amidohydrolase